MPNVAQGNLVSATLLSLTNFVIKSDSKKRETDPNAPPTAINSKFI